MPYINIATTDLTSRDDVIIDMLTEVQSMVSRFSSKYRMDYDDCIQHASLLMLEVWSKIPDGYNVKAYLNATVRRGLYLMLKTFIDYDTLAFSLERARTEDGSMLSDMLEAPVDTAIKAEALRTEKVVETVHTVLHELCTIEEQEYAVHSFEMHAFVPRDPGQLCRRGRIVHKPVKERRTDKMRTSIRRIFAKDQRIQGLIQRETCVL